MKKVTTVSRNLNIASVFKFQGFEKLSKYELSRIKGGSEDIPPIVDPD